MEREQAADGTRENPSAVTRFVGRSAAVRRLLDDLEKIGATRCPVLIEGDSGSGKELVARIVHETGAGPGAPFEAVNCGAIPESLLESELFGHVPGAFTGAVRGHRGVFERAMAGTVFLDEIGEMSPSAQVKLLRVLQEGAFTPVGGERLGRTHARVIAATNKDLQVEVKRGRFRQDLFYRLNVFPIRIPPLRDRREDIDLLVEHFLEDHAEDWGRPRPSIHPDALRRLHVYSYPGNVRELQNIVDALLIESRGAKEITDRHVVAVFSRHRLEPPRMFEDDGDENGTDDEASRGAEVGPWVLDQLRKYHFNIALAERMLSARRREAADPRTVPVCSRSGLTYYLQGEGFRALARENWNLEAAALSLAGNKTLVPRVRSKLARFLDSAVRVMENGSKGPGPRLIALRRSLPKLPRTYHEDLLQVSTEFEQGRWSR